MHVESDRERAEGNVCVRARRVRRCSPMLPSYHPSQGKATLSAAELLSCFVLPSASEHEAEAAGFHAEGSCAHELFHELISDDLAFDEARRTHASPRAASAPFARRTRASRAHAVHPRVPARSMPRTRRTCDVVLRALRTQPFHGTSAPLRAAGRRAGGGCSSGARRCARYRQPGSRIRSD